jgi:hypothetical protein
MRLTSTPADWACAPELGEDDAWYWEQSFWQVQNGKDRHYVAFPYWKKTTKSLVALTIALHQKGCCLHKQTQTPPNTLKALSPTLSTNPEPSALTPTTHTGSWTMMTTWHHASPTGTHLK